MKIFKIFLNIIVVLLAVITLAGSLYVCMNENTSGGYSAVCDISPTSRRWISETFGESEDIVSLMREMSDFAINNFTYELQDYFLIQTADFDSFVFEKQFVGMCFEFAVFAKTVSLVWAEENNVELKSYLCNTYYYLDGEKSGHSYNFFECDGVTYYLDLTGDVTEYKRSGKVTGPLICRYPKETVNNRMYDPYRYNFV